MAGCNHTLRELVARNERKRRCPWLRRLEWFRWAFLFLGGACSAVAVCYWLVRLCECH